MQFKENGSRKTRTSIEMSRRQSGVPVLTASEFDSECLSSQCSREIAEKYYTLTQAAHASTKRYSALLTDFQNLIEVHGKTRKLVESADIGRIHAQNQLATRDEQIRQLERKNEEKEQTIRTLNAQLKDARGEVGNQLGKVNALQVELDERDSRMNIIRRNLKGQLECLSTEAREEMSLVFDAASSPPMMAESDAEESVDYDESSREVSRIEVDEEQTPVRTMATTRRTPTTRRPLASGRQLSRASRAARNSAVRSPSALALTSVQTVKTTVLFDESQRQLKTTVAIKRTSCTPRVAKNWTGGQPIDRREHRFEKYTGLTKKCAICFVGFFRLGRPAVRCVDCNQHVHDKCKHMLRCACVPHAQTPRARMAKASRLPITPSASTHRRSNALKPSLHEFCPTVAPMIPVPVVRCVIALEQKGLHAEGIYRIPGNRAKIHKVLEELCEMRDVLRLLHGQETEVLTGCIKTFLANLRDPLIPKTSRAEFVRAATDPAFSEAKRQEEFEKAIRDLPQPNRDTLAYLCLHWHKVIALAPYNKMPLENVARCLAPTVVGLNNLTTLRSAGDDTTSAIAVLEKLLRMGTAYWEQYLSFEDLDKSINALSSTATRASSNMNTSKPLWR